MAFSVEEFRSNLNHVGGLASPSRFAVYITAPSFMSGVAPTHDDYAEGDLTYALNDSMNVADSRVLSMLCSDTNLPGKSLTYQEVMPQGFGKSVKMPSGITHETLQTQFLLDNNHRVLNYMQYWFQEIINTSSEFEGSNATFKNRTSYEINYKKSYATTMIIQFYANGDENQFIEYEFHDVYPIQIGTVNLAWDQTDQIAKLPVEFTYSGYTTFRGALGGLGTYATRGVDYYQSSNTFGSLFSALTDTNYGIRNLVDSFTNVSNIF